MLRRSTPFLTDQRGAAAAEMALILPLALALLFTTFEGAYYMICEHRVIKGVRDAARYAARLDLTNYACPGATFSGTAATKTGIQNLARTGQLSPDSTTLARAAKVWGTDPNKVIITVTCASSQGGIYAATGGNAPKVKISARVVYPSIMASLGFTRATIDIGAAAQSPVIGL